MINGVPCRTMYDRQMGTRVPIACAGEVAVRKINCQRGIWHLCRS